LTRRSGHDLFKDHDIINKKEMKLIYSKIIGTGSYLSEQVVTNENLFEKIKNFDSDKARKSLEKGGVDVSAFTIIDVFKTWVKGVSGIVLRHFSKISTEEMAAVAAKEALLAAGISAADIEYIIFASFTPAFEIPNPACTLAGSLGISAGGIQTNTACCGFVDAMITADAYIKSQKYKTILVVASEALTKKVNYDDPTTAILFGDGAGAAILQASDKPGVINTFQKSNYDPGNITLESRGTIKMGGGPLVLKKAVYAMKEAAYAVLDTSSFNKGGRTSEELIKEEVDYIIPHQANERIIDSLVANLGLPKEKFCKTISEIGNVSGASGAITLDRLIRGKLTGQSIKRGDKLLFTSVGGGYTLASLYMIY
jgi:3-oxoacyl-[acyl-carrier-protein] synthase III